MFINSGRVLSCRQIRQILSFLLQQRHRQSLSFIRNSHLSSLIMSSKKPKPPSDWPERKDLFLNMSIEQKRAQYKVKSNYTTLNRIEPWSEYFKNEEVKPTESLPVCPLRPDLNEKVCIFIGDICALEVDAIVNAANKELKGGGGVDGCIHRAAGPCLLDECETLNGCETGDAKLTGGYKLPAKYVIQTVGPIGENKEALASCYRSSLKLAMENKLRSVAFPCISTGIYGYPHDKAARVAISTVREILEQYESHFDKIIFVIFMPEDLEFYNEFMQVYFPV